MMGRETPGLAKGPILVLVGPTAVGKSALAIALAEGHTGEIISADSRLLYRGMDIGTAKPTREQRAHIRHHLIDVTEPDRPWSLAEFKSAALEAIDDIHCRSRLPILVGGTGQYVRAILEGWEIPRTPPDPGLREELLQRAQREGEDALFAELANRDPEAAARIDPRNVRRVARALEVIYSTGRPYSLQRRRAAPGYPSLQIGLTMPRERLYAQADARIEAMLAAGWIEEVRALLDKGYPPSLPAFSALGYRQIALYLQGELTREECLREIRSATHRLIRHQANWFKMNDADLHWIQAGPGAPAEAAGVLQEFLRHLAERNAA